MKSRKVILFFWSIVMMLVMACTTSMMTLAINTPVPTVVPTPELSTNIPAVVEGVIIDKPSRDWDGTVLEMFRLTVRTMTGVTYTVPVDVETYVRAWWDQSVRLDCSQMPCVREGLITGVVMDAPQTSYIVTLKKDNGTVQIYDVDPTVSASVHIGQTITLDCVNSPCVFAAGEQ